eukprot:Sspe_Gene.83547::Locus_54804_Transcript_1_1_Confidence_1.000_Length_1275::g.83547::m.83547
MVPVWRGLRYAPLRSLKSCRHVTTVREALEILGLDVGVAFPRGKAGVDGRAAVSGVFIEDLRRRYKELAKIHHPDQNAATGGEDRMKEINAAYAFLKAELPKRGTTHEERKVEEETKEKEEQRRAQETRYREYSQPREPPHMGRRRARERLHFTVEGEEEFTEPDYDKVEQDTARFIELLRRKTQRERLQGVKPRRGPRTTLEEARRQLMEENNGSI